jgi:hypothetical protein
MMFRDKTLPMGAVPAKLLCSGEYSIRCKVDLVKKWAESLHDPRTFGVRLAVNGVGRLRPATMPGD